MVGAIIVGRFIFAGIVFLVRRSKRRNVLLDEPDQAADKPVDVFSGDHAELDSRVQAELHSSVRPELDSRAH